MSRPLAWIAVFDGEPDGEFIWWDEAKARRWIERRPGVELAPLFMQPTLTDEEREAIEAADAYMSAAGCHNTNVQKTLRGLLERLR